MKNWLRKLLGLATYSKAGYVIEYKGEIQKKLYYTLRNAEQAVSDKGEDGDYKFLCVYTEDEQAQPMVLGSVITDNVSSK